MGLVGMRPAIITAASPFSGSAAAACPPCLFCRMRGLWASSAFGWKGGLPFVMGESRKAVATPSFRLAAWVAGSRAILFRLGGVCIPALPFRRCPVLCSRGPLRAFRSRVPIATVAIGRPRGVSQGDCAGHSVFHAGSVRT